MQSMLDIIECLRNNILFSGIENDEFFQKFAEKLEKKSLKEKTCIYQQGDEVDGLYLIISGKILIYTVRDNERYILSHAETHHLVGEFLLLGRSVRSSSAEVVENAELLFLSIADLIELIKRFPIQGSLLGTRIVNRLSWNQTILALRLSHLFAGLNQDIVRQLINELEIISIPSNSLLYKQHEVSDDLCIIIDGQFQVNRFTESGNEILCVIGRGETIGEIGVICQTPRAANVLAIRDSTIGRLSKNSYEKILKSYPLEINQTFVKSVIKHLTRHEKLSHKPTEAIVLVVLSSHLSKIEISRQLVDSLAEYGLTISLTSEIVDIAFNKKNVAQCSFQDELNYALLQWMSEQEIAHRYVVYVIDDTMSLWTKRCLRQADHILFFADAKADSDISLLEKQVLSLVTNKSIKKTLVLNHFSSTNVPSDSLQWLNPRSINMHHHVRNENQSDFGRVARFISGNAVGVVLGGGGARGFAHIGVIRAFHELKIPIDLIGGNSMGAVIAAQYAMQWDSKDMINNTKNLCLQGDQLTFPVLSIFSGKKMTRGLFDMFGERCIEDLWLHFFSISCNISRASIMIHDKDSLLSAVMNSNAPPGLFPPQIVDGDLLVDGALLNNVPVDVMEKYNEEGIIIAVDVNSREELLDNTDNRGGISGWRLLVNKFNPLAKKIKMPNIIEILSRASIIGGLAQRKKLMDGIADLYMQPPVNKFSLMAYKDAEEIEEVGYIYAKQELQQWLNKKMVPEEKKFKS